MKHTFIRLCLCSILFFIPLQMVTAESNTYRVWTDHLVVRQSPDANSAIIGYLQKDSEVAVFKEAYGWAQTYYKGEEAWVAKQYLVEQTQHTGQATTETNEQVAAKTTNHEQLTVDADEVRLRSGPGTNYSIIDQLAKGTNIQHIGTDGDWYKVTTTSGTTGWIAAWLTTKQHQEAQTVKEQNNNSTPKGKRSSLNGLRIVLDAGHGGEDSGSIGLHSVYEKQFTLETTQTIKATLEQYGAEVLMTRTNDTYVPLEKRVQMSNQFAPDLFLSIHYDAYPVTTTNGFSTHFYKGTSSRNLAYTFQNELAKQLPINNRGVMQDDYYVLRHTNSEALLLELGFLTNFEDLYMIQSTNYKNQVANGVKNALLQVF